MLGDPFAGGEGAHQREVARLQGERREAFAKAHRDGEAQRRKGEADGLKGLIGMLGHAQMITSSNDF